MIIRLTGARASGKTKNTLRIATQLALSKDIVVVSNGYICDKSINYNELYDLVLNSDERIHIKCLVIDDLMPSNAKNVKLLLKAIDYDILIVNYIANYNLRIDFIHSINYII